MSQVKDLDEFLTLAELQDYYSNFKDLKVNNVPQLKYVEEEDLVDMGMTKPEIRRFKKFFRKECPQGTFSKLRKKILTVSTTVVTRETNGHSSSPPTPSAERSPLSKTSNKTIIPEESITLLKILGTGEFGTVQQGCWTNDNNKKTQVAIKCLSRDKMQTGMPDFLKEATMMQTIDHDHIVRLFGVVLGQEALMLVTELAPMRSLLECLKDPLMRSTFPVLRLCEFAIQVCDGMSYLENKRFIHRDLAARNILVYTKDKVKISDFGLSRALGVGKDYYQTNFNINLRLPIAWCAPECINYLKFTSSSDIWAFGVTLWEMFTYGQQPWATLTGQQILDSIDEPSSQRLEQPEYCPRDMYDVMLKCWEHDPEVRPKFTELLLMLPQIKPECVQAKRDGALVKDDDNYSYFKQSDIITVLDKRPEEAPEEDMWKGILDSGKTGYFKTDDTAPYIEIKCVASPILRNKPKITRKESSRKSSRSSKKFDISMISGPQDDLRHTGHIGYDGAVFGDVSFIGSQYNRLPLKVGPTGATNGVMSASAMSLTRSDVGSESHLVTQSQSEACILDKFPLNNSNSYDVSSVLVADGVQHDEMETENSTSIDKYEDIDDFGGFSMPSFSSSLDLGGSLMDEVMKAWTVSDEQPDTSTTSTATNNSSRNLTESIATTAIGATSSNTSTVPNTNTLTDDKSPLLEKEPSFSSFTGTGMTASFDNIAMANDNDSLDTNNEDRDGSTTPELSHSQEFIMNNIGIELPSVDMEKKRRPKLKIQHDSEESDDYTESIPGRGRQKGIRTLSESEERQMDEAIELANSYAMKGATDHMVATPSPKSLESLSDRSHGDSDGNSSISSPKGRSVFNLRKKSPKQERKTFTDEIAGISDASEDVTVEAQEAYNMLIVKGSIQETTDKDSGASSTSREFRRMHHRTRDHTTSSDSSISEKPAVAPRANRNIRAPQGIPGRSASVDVEVPDSNPLRRLRESVAVIPPKTKPRPGNHHPTELRTDRINGKAENAKKPNLSANLPFFDKLKEQELSQDSGEGSEEGINPVPLPPRIKSKSNPVKTSTNSTPRQRKYPLDLSQYKGNTDPSTFNNHHHQNIYANKHSPMSSSSLDKITPEREVTNSDFLNASHDSSDSVFSSCSPNSSLERPLVDHSIDQEHQAMESQFSVKSVKLTARDLGYQDTSDLFWAKPVNLEDFGGSNHVPIPGRYKTSDTVSYEDILEFALDGVSERESEQDICDEVRLMRKILTKDVTIEDCMYCLEETGWAINSAIKLVKLKQVLSTNLGDKDKCKEVLMKCDWDVQEAANYLIQHPPGQESPELIHV